MATYQVRARPAVSHQERQGAELWQELRVDVRRIGRYSKAESVMGAKADISFWLP